MMSSHLCISDATGCRAPRSECEPSPRFSHGRAAMGHTRSRCVSPARPLLGDTESMDAEMLSRRFVDAYNSRQLEAHIELFDPDVEFVPLRAPWRTPCTEVTTASGSWPATWTSRGLKPTSRSLSS